MERFPKTLTLILGLLCAVCASCVDSDNPLSDPKQATVDAGLLGVWRANEKEGDVTYYHVGKAGDQFPEGVLRVRTVVHDKNGELDRPNGDDTIMFTTTLGKNHYVNVTVLDAEAAKALGGKWDPAKAEGYFIYKYEIDGDKLMVATIDPDQKKAAIKAGKVNGKSKEAGDDSHFTDSTENLARFIASPDGDKIFFTKENPGEGYAALERVK
jgi:hypothetical protein